MVGWCLLVLPQHLAGSGSRKNPFVITLEINQPFWEGFCSLAGVDVFIPGLHSSRSRWRVLERARLANALGDLQSKPVERGLFSPFPPVRKVKALGDL